MNGVLGCLSMFSFRRVFKITASLFVISFLLLIITYFYVELIAASFIKPAAVVDNSDVIIVPGALVYTNGQVSPMLEDRLISAYELYKLGKSNKIIVTGDHGQETYDEVNNMRKFLEQKGVPRIAILMDHAGFDTYDSLYRAREVFKVKSAIIVSQSFHVIRAVYTARRIGINAKGVIAQDITEYNKTYYSIREIGSRFKAFCLAEIVRPKPKFLGEPIPFWKDGTLTDDGRS